MVAATNLYPEAWSFEMVPLANLKRDPTYHDPGRLKEKRVAEIAADWDPSGVGTITVSRRHDGSLWVIDGMHRVAAARLLGETHLPAKLFVGLTLEGEALMFQRLWGWREQGLGRQRRREGRDDDRLRGASPRGPGHVQPEDADWRAARGDPIRPPARGDRPEPLG